VDHAARTLIRSAAKLLVEAMNGSTLTNEESLRVHASYRRLIIALGVEAKLSKTKTK